MVCMADFGPETDREKLLELAATAVEGLLMDVMAADLPDLYEDGYSDALAKAAGVIRVMKLFHG